MKLDNKFLQELIEESLEELQQEEVESKPEESEEEKDPEGEEEIPGMDDVHAAFKDLQDKVKELEAKLEGKKEPKQMNETIQMTKGRLRQIVIEEMKKAKEQGLI